MAKEGKGYMVEQNERPTGLTRDVGFQIGVRRTLPIQLEDAWQLLISKKGVNIWLGETSKLDFSKGTRLCWGSQSLLS
jgi:hypothetical protein